MIASSHLRRASSQSFHHSDAWHQPHIARDFSPSFPLSPGMSLCCFRLGALHDRFQASFFAVSLSVRSRFSRISSCPNNSGLRRESIVLANTEPCSLTVSSAADYTVFLGCVDQFHLGFFCRRPCSTVPGLPGLFVVFVRPHHLFLN